MAMIPVQIGGAMIPDAEQKKRFQGYTRIDNHQKTFIYSTHTADVLRRNMYNEVFAAAHQQLGPMKVAIDRSLYPRYNTLDDVCDQMTGAGFPGAPRYLVHEALECVKKSRRAQKTNRKNKARKDLKKLRFDELRDQNEFMLHEVGEAERNLQESQDQVAYLMVHIQDLENQL